MFQSERFKTVLQNFLSFLRPNYYSVQNTNNAPEIVNKYNKYKGALDQADAHWNQYLQPLVYSLLERVWNLLSQRKLVYGGL